MSRHVQDTTATGPQPSPGGPALAGWDRAGLEAREALIRAAAALYGDTLSRRRPGVAAGSELARRIDAATVALICGRDLLQTHLAHGPSGGLRFRSEWGSILTTPRARWALLPEMGSLAHRLAPVGEQLGLSARARGSPRARQAVSDACHWLQIMDTSIRQAYRDEPALGADLELLRAVPVGACPPARRPDASGPVSGLPQAVIATAELARHTAWLSGGQPPWRPGMSVNSLRQAAAASTLTSYHCETLLRFLARRQRLAGEPGTALRAAAGAASRARIRWRGQRSATPAKNLPSSLRISSQGSAKPGRVFFRVSFSYWRPARDRWPASWPGSGAWPRFPAACAGRHPCPGGCPARAGPPEPGGGGTRRAQTPVRRSRVAARADLASTDTRSLTAGHDGCEARTRPSTLASSPAEGAATSSPPASAHHSSVDRPNQVGTPTNRLLRSAWPSWIAAS